MAFFFGTGADEEITPAKVSNGVVGTGFPSAVEDFIDGGGGDDLLKGAGGDDTLYGDGGFDTLYGGNGDDDLFGLFDGLLGDLMFGGNGDDVFYVADNDTAEGGADDDLFFVQNALLAPAQLLGDAGYDSLYSGSVTTNFAGTVIGAMELLVLGIGNVTFTTTQFGGFERVERSFPTVGTVTLTLGGNADLELAIQDTLEIIGSAFADGLTFTTVDPLPTNLVLDAGGGDDTIVAGGGDDSLTGGDGADSLLGGDGDDTLLGGDGDDLDGGAGDDALRLVEALIVPSGLNGGIGIDRLSADGTSTDSVVLGVGVTVSGIEELAIGAALAELSAAQLGSFDTVLFGKPFIAGDGAIQLTAGGGAAVAIEGFSTLSIDGSAAADVLVLEVADATALDLQGLGGNDAFILTGLTAASTIAGNGGDDTISGGAGDDMLKGGGGDDLITLGANDTALGASGEDEFRVAAADGKLTGVVQGGADLDTLAFQGAHTIATAAVIQGVEQLALDGDALTLTTARLARFDTIVADGSATSGVLILATSGTATVAVEGLVRLAVTGASGAENLTFLVTNGSTGFDILAGLGNDTIATADHADLIDGGVGDDSLIGGGGADTLQGGAGRDTMAANENDSVDAGSDDDRIILDSGPGNDETVDIATLVGGDGLDTLALVAVTELADAVVLSGIEQLELGATPLSLNVAQLDGFDTVLAGAGVTSTTLLLRGGGSATTEVTGLSALVVGGDATAADLLTFTTATTAMAVLGFGGDDVLVTGGGQDVLVGGDGADDLSGGIGADTLLGGAGADILRGQGGNDAFRYGTASEGEDTVVAFLGGADRIEVSAGGFGGGLAAGVVAQFTANTAGVATAAAGTGQFVFDTDDEILLWDVDGSGGAAASRIVSLAGAVFAATDIVVIL